MIVLRLHLALLLSLLVSGCATTEYGCKGMPEDPKCLSTTEAYQLSNNDLPNSHGIHHDASIDTASVSSSDSVSSVVTGLSVTSGLIQQPTPKIDDPTPIRTPAQVMRIWIAPWEDREGDLMVSNYVYTELEPRRWMIGKSAPTISPTLIPLQVEQRAAEKRLEADQNGDELRSFKGINPN